MTDVMFCMVQDPSIRPLATSPSTSPVNRMLDKVKLSTSVAFPLVTGSLRSQSLSLQSLAQGISTDVKAAHVIFTSTCGVVQEPLYVS